jgi:flagellar brake protein
MSNAIPANQPAIVDPSEYDEFMLRTPNEVLRVLRGLQERVAQITLFFNEGKEMLLTTLAAVADDHLILDHGASSETNRKALEASKHFCITQLDKVRIQFILRKFSLTEYGGRPAFRCALPDELLRLQRREYFRLITPVVRPLKCEMTLPLPAGGTCRHVANVFDISGGGLALSAPQEGIPFAVGMELPGCRVDLPEVGLITGTLKVKSLFEIMLHNGTRVQRVGCEFVNLPGPMMTLIQRYIIKVERERKARESGLSF